jgi:uncharacterized delta-60 repeat protein
MSVSHKCLKSALGLSIFLIAAVLFVSSIQAAIVTGDQSNGNPNFSSAAQLNSVSKSSFIENNPVSFREAQSLEFGNVVNAPPSKFVKKRTDSLLADSDVDAGFNASVSEGFGYVKETLVQPDGKIIIAGSFSNIKGVPRGYLARLNADGSIDGTFNPGGAGPGGAVLALARQPDGRNLIGGNIGFYNGTFSGLVTRLNADGTLDPTFNGGSNANSTIDTIAVQADGRILIGGFFTTYNGITRNRIARLNPDGSLDQSFNPGSGFNNSVFSIVQQPDGKILVGGAFRQYNGAIANGIVRLNLDGSLDASFNPGGSGANTTVETIVLQPNGRILVGGSFSSFIGTSTPLGLVRLSANGAIETAFTLGGLAGTITAIAVLPNNSFLAGGNFFTGTETTRGIASFDFPLGTSFGSSSVNSDILSIASCPTANV